MQATSLATCLRPSCSPFVSALLAVWLASCGQTKVVCPPGSHYSGSGTVCLPDQAGGPGPGAEDTVGVADSTAAEDSGTAADAPPAADAGAEVGTADAAAPDSQPDTAKPDVKVDVSSGKSVVGAACSDDYDCVAGLACYTTWPKGYCTVPNCDAPGSNCPGSSVCYGETKTKLCHVACEADSDCRKADGYACKRLSAAFGGIDAQLCAPGGKNPIGLGCSKASDCAGSATCLTDMPGGYCARLGCGISDPCDTGQACVLRNGKPVCLKTCVADVECQIGGGNPRKCVDKSDLSKAAVKVCLDTTKSSPVGAACLSDLDCDTKLCAIFAKGTCTVGAQACLSDEQCGAAGPCKIDPTKEQGVCTAPCNKDKACPVNSLCVPGKDGTAGSCQPTCKGPGDDASCGGVPGLTCLFGKPMPAGGSAPPPQYACAPLPAGIAGAPCTQTKDCTLALCLLNAQQNAGYCAPDCATGSFCPFGAVCDDNGLAQCLKLCTTDFDCPAAFGCKAVSGIVGKVCLPP